MLLYCVFFFFKQKTAYDMRISDWSSDVCSSDLLSRNRNEVLELPDNLQFEAYDFGNGDYAHRIVEGNPLGSFYGYRYLGVYQNEEETYARSVDGNLIYDLEGEAVVISNGPEKVYPGDARYQTVDGNGVINQYDIVYLGNDMQLFTTGGGFNIRYKGFTLSTFLHGRFGSKVVNQVRSNTANMHGRSEESSVGKACVRTCCSRW